MMSDSQILVSQKVSTEKETYHKLIFTAQQGVFKLWFHQRYWIVGNSIYVVTLTIEKELLQEYIETGTEISGQLELNQE